MALRSLASHSTAQLRRLVGQLQAELDTLEKIATPDADAQRQLAEACLRLRSGMDSIEDAIRCLRGLQHISASSPRSKALPKRA